MDSADHQNLNLLGRPDLSHTYTKLHAWRLTQYDKCVFLDADTLVSICYGHLPACVCGVHPFPAHCTVCGFHFTCLSFVCCTAECSVACFSGTVPLLVSRHVFSNAVDWAATEQFPDCPVDIYLISSVFGAGLFIASVVLMVRLLGY